SSLYKKLYMMLPMQLVTLVSVLAKALTWLIALLLLFRLVAGFCYAVLVSNLRRRINQLRRALNEVVNDTRLFSHEEKLLLLKPDKELFGRIAAVSISGEQ
ncbi:hypothetical protein BOX15_Mlig015762g1, partial [Macrostomum lignano]